MKNKVKIVLAILLLICLLEMPYAYFQLVRYAALVGFSFLAYEAYQQEKKAEVFTFICLAILFQPLFKLALGRQLWNFVDVLVAIGLILSIFSKLKKGTSSQSG